MIGNDRRDKRILVALSWNVIIPFRMTHYHLGVGYAIHPEWPPKVAGPFH